MSPVQETLFDLLLNALPQIGFFAVVAASSRVSLRKREQTISISSISQCSSCV
jgi:hypothetical protein